MVAAIGQDELNPHPIIPHEGNLPPDLLAIRARSMGENQATFQQDNQEKVRYYRSLKDRADIAMIGGASLAIIGVTSSILLLSPPGLPLVVATISVIALTILTAGAIFPFVGALFSLSKLAAAKIIYRLYSPNFAFISSVALISLSGIGIALLGSGFIMKEILNRKIKLLIQN